MISFDKNSLTAIILSAGFGSRMGRAKALLPIEGKTFIETIIGNLESAGFASICVVLGFKAEEIKTKLPEKVDTIINPHPESEMLSSILLGLDFAERDGNSALIAMVDYPLVKCATYKALAVAHSVAPDLILLPEFEGKTGHPVVFPKSVFGQIRKIPAGFGARLVVQNNPGIVSKIPINDPGILCGINTREDYENFIGKFPEE